MDSHSQYYLWLGITDHCAGDTWRGDSRYTRYTTFSHRFALQPALAALSHLHYLSYVALPCTVHASSSIYRRTRSSNIVRTPRYIRRSIKKLCHLVQKKPIRGYVKSRRSVFSKSLKLFGKKISSISLLLLTAHPYQMVLP